LGKTAQRSNSCRQKNFKLYFTILPLPQFFVAFRHFQGNVQVAGDSGSMQQKVNGKAIMAYRSKFPSWKHRAHLLIYCWHLAFKLLSLLWETLWAFSVKKWSFYEKGKKFWEWEKKDEKEMADGFKES